MTKVYVVHQFALSEPGSDNRADALECEIFDKSGDWANPYGSSTIFAAAEDAEAAVRKLYAGAYIEVGYGYDSDEDMEEGGDLQWGVEGKSFSYNAHDLWVDTVEKEIC